jgi:hypothetical protein
MFLLGGAAAFSHRAVRAYMRRHDAISIDRKGVALVTPTKSVSVSWADMTRVEVLKVWTWGDEFYVRGENGEIAFDDTPGMHHRQVARALFQYVLFCEMRKRNTWDHVRALDELKL